MEPDVWIRYETVVEGRGRGRAGIGLSRYVIRETVKVR